MPTRTIRTLSAITFLLLSTVLLGACSGDRSPTGYEESAVLLSVTPPDGIEALSPTDPIVLNFDRRMDPAACEPQVTLHEGDLEGPVVAVSYSWSEEGTVLTVTPMEPLKPATTYTLNVGGGMRDGSGRPVDLAPAQQHSGGQWNGTMAGQGPGYGQHGGQGGPKGQGGRSGAQHRGVGLVYTFTTL